jgi:cytoskeleton protein RodZ
MEKKRSTSFGEYLKTVRLEKGIRLSDISSQTRISKDTLAALEAEDHARLPAEVFVKGFIRAYSRVVGADGDVAIQRFVDSRPLGDVGSRFKPDETGPRSRTGVRLLVCLCVLVVIAAVAFFVMRPEKSVKTSEPAVQPRPSETAVVKKTPPVVKEMPLVVKETPPPDPTEPAPEAAPEPAVPAVPAEPEIVPAPGENIVAGPQIQMAAASPEAVAPGPRQHLHIQVVEETWLKVISDSLNTDEYSLAPGDTLDLAADKGFNLLIGNASGIELTFNETPVSIPGKSGQVVTLQLP